MNYLDRSIARHFPDYTSLEEESKDEMKEAALLYLFRGVGSSALTTVFRSVLDTNVSLSLYRNHLTTDGYILKSIKGFLLYSVSIASYKSRQKSENVARTMFGLEGQDYELARHLLQNEQLRLTLESYIGQYPVFTQEKFDRVLASIMEPLKKWAFFFVRRKLRFVCQANSLDPSDLESELVYKGMQTFMMTYPCFDSKLHAVNIAKRAMHNHGINLIMFYTSQSRGTLYANKDGTFSSRKVSYEELADLYALGDADALVSNDLGSIASSAFIISGEEKYTRISIKQTYEAATPKKRRFLTYLMGEYCEKFSTWLREHGFTRLENDEYYDKLAVMGHIKKYVNLCLDFLGVPKDSGYAYLRSLKVSLA